MKISREKHLRHMTRLMPYLMLAYAAQSYLYLKYVPEHIAVDVTIFVGVGIVLVTAGFALYNHFHQVSLHKHHLSSGLMVFGLKEEILYRNIQYLDIETSRHGYFNVTLYLRDGTIHKLFYLDDVSELNALIKSSL
jgi:hypothetical protein